MNVTEVRQKLHHLIDTIDDKNAIVMYSIFNKNIKAVEEDYTDEFKAELDRRYEEYKKDGIVISRDAMDNRVKKILGQA